MSVGKSEDHGQHSHPSEKGEKGDTGVNPLVVRKALGAYVTFFVGIILFVFYSQWLDRQDRERDAVVMEAFAEQVVATDRAFCAVATDNRISINANREDIRTLESAVRQSFELVQPSADTPPAQRAAVLEFRRQILAKLDAVKVEANLPLPDCSAIGNGHAVETLQESIMGTTTTSIP